ncbi:MAG: cation transporter [Alphaproteobacteria bacterium]|nr:cation transporter [Alphaproteobacteria bacterium]
MTDAREADRAFRKAVRFVALANLIYFFIEFVAGQVAGSVSLFADSIDFLEDAAVNLLVLLALDWAPRARARMGMTLAALLLVPSAAALWTGWTKLQAPVAPDPFILSIAGLGALAVNVVCSLRLASFRSSGGSLARAAFLSARNDAVANIAIIGAGLVTLVWASAWPDLIVGIAIAALNAGAAREVWEAARGEHDAAP